MCKTDYAQRYLELVELPKLREFEFDPYPDEHETIVAFGKYGCKFKINKQNRVASLMVGANHFNDSDVEKLAPLSALDELVIGSAIKLNGVTQVGIVRLFEVRNLISLQLIGLSSIDSRALSPCFENSSLVFLDVTGCAIAELDSLSPASSQLHYLRLGFCEVGRRSLEFLCGLKSLKRLHLLGTNISLGEKSELERALPNCTVIVEQSRGSRHP